MSYFLSEKEQKEVYDKLKEVFSDLHFFDQIVSEKLKLIISDSNKVEIDTKTTRKLTERYFDIDSFQTEPQKFILSHIHVILKVCYVLILCYREDIKSLFWKDPSQLLKNYPQFSDQPEDELNYLLKFRNMMRVSLNIVPARLNKQLLLKIAARLEGSGREYITGGGQKPCVQRRVDIYEKEGNIRAEQRTDRPRVPKLDNQLKKRPRPQMNLKEIKLKRLPSEEVQLLTRGPQDPFSSSQKPSQEQLDTASDLKLPVNENDILLRGFSEIPIESHLENHQYYTTYDIPEHRYNDAIEELFSYNNNYQIVNNNVVHSEFKIPENPYTNYSSTFPPILSREQSELIDSLLPDGEFWRGSSISNIETQQNNSSFAFESAIQTNPLNLMREISWDIYNGTFGEDLQSYLAPTQNS